MDKKKSKLRLGSEGDRRRARRVNGGSPEVKELREWLEGDGRGRIMGDGMKGTKKPYS